MLLGVLRMPIKLWTVDQEFQTIENLQRHSRYLEAADRIEADADRIATLEQRISAHNERMEAICADCPQRQKGRTCLDCMRQYMIED